MKNKKYLYTNLLSASQLKMLKDTFDGMFGVKAGQGYINWLIRASVVIFKKKRPSITRSSFVFIRDIHRLYSKSSRKFVVLYLKTCHVLVMQSVGGYHVKDCQLIGGVRVSRTKRGLPRIIPKLHREEIRKGNVLYIKLYLTFFSLYRLISFGSIVSLDTIIEPGVVLKDNLVSDFRLAAIFLFKSLGINLTTFAKDMKPPIPY
jgi:hypothetical protein